MADPPGGTLTHLNPILNVTDLDASIAFYTEILGFKLLHTFGDPADFAIIGHGDHQIYLCHNCQGQRGTWLALFVSDPEGLHEHLMANAVELTMALEASGSEFRANDPDGHVLRFFVAS
ncbi:VOC family protein [Kribbella sp. NBC_01505]|uniref:VOC family protein n=1 Tax=Kribbella sp. NBC_01505 TaxID=2903580 RepID=UPI0038653353